MFQRDRWHRDAGGSHSEEQVLPCGHWPWRELFWDPRSSLLAPRPSSARQPVGISTGTSQAKQLAGGDTAPPPGGLLPQDALSHSRSWIRLCASTRGPGTWLHTPGCKHHLRNTKGPGARGAGIPLRPHQPQKLLPCHAPSSPTLNILPSPRPSPQVWLHSPVGKHNFRTSSDPSSSIRNRPQLTVTQQQFWDPLDTVARDPRTRPCPPTGRFKISDVSGPSDSGPRG